MQKPCLGHCLPCSLCRKQGICPPDCCLLNEARLNNEGGGDPSNWEVAIQSLDSVGKNKS